MSSNIQRPATTDYAQAFGPYVGLVPEADILGVLDNQSQEVADLTSNISAEQAAFRYAPDKWSIREVMGHLADSERVFGFRAMALARGERAELPGFEENEYVDHGDFDDWSLSDLVAQFQSLRSSNVQLFKHLSDDAWKRSGIVNGNSITVPSLAWIIAGHLRHHIGILNERYLSKLAG
ncbi:MAG: DinB family protein [Acidobacteriota bacterium]